MTEGRILAKTRRAWLLLGVEREEYPLGYDHCQCQCQCADCRWAFVPCNFWHEVNVRAAGPACHRFAFGVKATNNGQARNSGLVLMAVMSKG